MMTDLDLRFGALDLVEPTDLVDEIDQRAALPEPAPRPERPRRRIAAGLVAAAVFATGAVLVWSALRPIDRDLLREPTPAPDADDPWSWAPEGWTELPPPPEWRDPATIVWTGSQLLYWGGVDPSGDRTPLRDGFSFDPARRIWSPIPPAPIASSSRRGIWTGSEALFFDADPGAAERGVLAFDPGEGSWRVLSRSPHQPSWGGAWAWTGSELIVVGGGDPGDPETRAAAALDPERNTWRQLPNMPIAVSLADATWTGSEVVVVGSEMDRRNRATTRTSVAAAYDPGRDAWRRLPDPPVSAQTAAIEWVDGRLLAWEGYSPAAAEYLPDEDRWRSIDSGDLEGGECYASGVIVSRSVLTWDCGEPAAWFSETSTWARLAPPLLGRTDQNFSLGVEIDGGSVAVIEHFETIEEDGVPHIGLTNAPRHLWVWKPSQAPVLPAAVTTGDAENLVDSFLSDWQPGWEIYLPTLATEEVLEILYEGEQGVPSFDGWAFRSWDRDRARQVAMGTFEVPIELIREKEIVASLVFTVGPGTTADGREGQLVIVGVRADD
jgi:hypothetical protein